jgi:membrane-bound metal-dependent hydrolase YbcI (DUF457 family)
VKGIAHFLTGVAVATFFPEIVYSASQSLSFGPVLGGVAGLLPDTLDFKFLRYFERLDQEIDPAKIVLETGEPDPQAMAERISASMKQALECDRLVRIQLHTLKVGADLWQRWSVSFDQARGEVTVNLGPPVTTGEVPLPGNDPSSPTPRVLSVGRAPLPAPLLYTYDDEIIVDIFSGPSLAFEPTDGALKVTFLPWHRAWSHSLLMALVLALLGLLLSPVYGLVVALAILAHMIEDQLGFMGVNFLFPSTSKRTLGLRLIRSGDAIPNFTVVWVSLAVILLNLDRFSAEPSIAPLPYVLVVIVLPSLFCLGLYAWLQVHAPRPPAEVMAAVEALDETSEVDI